MKPDYHLHIVALLINRFSLVEEESFLHVTWVQQELLKWVA